MDHFIMEVWLRSFSFLFMGDGCRFQPLIFQGVLESGTIEGHPSKFVDESSWSAHQAEWIEWSSTVFQMQSWNYFLAGVRFGERENSSHFVCLIFLRKKSEKSLGCCHFIWFLLNESIQNSHFIEASPKLNQSTRIPMCNPNSLRLKNGHAKIP